jgi:hypothetical protein
MIETNTKRIYFSFFDVVLLEPEPMVEHFLLRTSWGSVRNTIWNQWWLGGICRTQLQHCRQVECKTLLMQEVSDSIQIDDSHVVLSNFTDGYTFKSFEM